MTYSIGGGGALRRGGRPVCCAGTGGWSRAGSGLSRTLKIKDEDLRRDMELYPDACQRERAGRRAGPSSTWTRAASRRGRPVRRALPWAARLGRGGGSTPFGLLLTVSLMAGPVNAEMFHRWVIGDLLPKPPPSCVVVMGNAAFHRADIRRAVEDAGHRLEFLPPASPTSTPSNTNGRRPRPSAGASAAPSRNSSRTAPCNQFIVV